MGNLFAFFIERKIIQGTKVGNKLSLVCDPHNLPKVVNNSQNGLLAEFKSLKRKREYGACWHLADSGLIDASFVGWSVQTVGRT